MNDICYYNKTILIVGLGISGRSAAYFLLTKGANVFGIDRNLSQLENSSEVIALKSQGLKLLEESAISHLKDFDLIVISPGIAPTHFIYEHIRQWNTPVIGEIELGCRSAIQPIIGITGTNGKTTVTLLVTHVLNYVNKKARALGNIGVPLAHELDKMDSNEIIVLELSSYELETLYTPAINVGVILNITPDHLDRYDSMDSYAQAKCYLERCMRESGCLYIGEQAYKQFGSFLRTANYKLIGYSSECFINSDLESVYRDGQRMFELPASYKGFQSHDLENIMAAYALCHEMGVEPYDFLNALNTFKKPPHRIEFVIEKNGAFYYDDSKGTNIDAVNRAVHSLKGPIILIAGGVDKGSSYTAWLQGFKNKVKYICAIGHAACKIKAELSHCIPVEIFKDMDEAVRKAAHLADQGDNVLLSPGCASYDMFRDYVHRGEEFQRIVRSL